jgi:hypothetical protein
MQGKPQSATYATVKDVIISYIQKTFKDGNDVAQSIKEGKTIDLKEEEPKRVISDNEDEKLAKLEQTGYDIKYQEELRHFLDRKHNLRQGLTKAYALIFTNYCNRVMQSRVEEHPEFEKKIENDPIALLDSIKMLMHDPIRAQYPMASMTEALTRLVNTKQLDNESFLDYLKRFKQTRDVVKVISARVFSTSLSNKAKSILKKRQWQPQKWQQHQQRRLQQQRPQQQQPKHQRQQRKQKNRSN